MKKPIYAILEEASAADSKEGMIEALRRNDNHCLRMVLYHAFHPQVKFLIPEGRPPDGSWKKSEFDEPFRLYQEERKFYLFVEGVSPAGLTAVKRERLFLELLESLDPNEAEVVIAMKDKTLPYPKITRKIVAAAFPGMIP